MAHQRIRPTAQPGLCMAVRAGAQITLQAQGGIGLDGAPNGATTPAGQAAQALLAIEALLHEAGARLPALRTLTLTVTDRAWLAPALDTLTRALAPATPALTVLITAGLAAPSSLLAIEAEAAVACLPE